MRRAMNPVLALVGAVVIIDALCERSITSVLRRNRGETLAAGLWLFVHLAKDEEPNE